MSGKPAARLADQVAHVAPPVLTGGPGSSDVIIGFRPAWRGVPASVAAGLKAAKKTSDAAIETAEAASRAAMGTPAAPAAKAAEELAKSTAAAAMGSAITSAAGGADIHMCATPLPLPPHGPGVVINGSSTVLINNLPGCRQGDTILEAVGPPNRITKGLASVLIGGASISSATVSIAPAMSAGDVESGVQNFGGLSSADALEEVDPALIRGDDVPYEVNNSKGWAKSHVSENGDLVPANPSGKYKGRDVSVAEHVLGGFRRGAKSNSPYSSFTRQDEKASGYGTSTIEIDLPALREAIANKELPGVKILETSDVLKAIESDPNLSDYWKNLALKWAERDGEILIRGIVPARFVKVY